MQHLNINYFLNVSFSKKALRQCLYYYFKHLSLLPLLCRKVMSAPNVFRVGAAENIFVECQDCTGGDIRVDINVMNHPTKIKLLAKTIVTLSRVNNFQQFGKIKIPAGDFNKDPSVKQYVYLQAQFPDCLLEKVVMVSFQSGYIFIQTDKTLYTPNSRVLFRVFGLTPQMEPLERDEEIQTDTSIIIQFVTPEGIILLLRQVFLRSGLYSGSFHLDETVSTGLWKVVAKFHSNPQQKYSAEFEVKEYVLPSFEVKLTPLTQFFYVNSRDFTVRIKATYLFGQEVDGTAYVVFGVRKGQRKQSFPDSLQKVPIRSGEGEVTLRREDITKVENDINSLVGGAIFVSVSVLTESGSEMVEAELRGIQIVTSPYTINFKRTPKYFKPGMSFDVRVEVLNPDETPAANIPVVINPGAVRGLTAANGMAWLTINTGGNEAELRITAMTDNPMVSPDRQARAEMIARPYSSKTGTFIHIGVDAPEKELGDNLRIYLFLNKQPNQNHDITYLIQSRGQLVKYGRYETRGQVPISLIQPITKEMLPSFRIIAYYHTSSNEVVSDSVWVDVKDTCMGTLKLEFTQPSPAYEPRRTFRLKVTASPEATVGLIVVDKGKQQLWEIVEESDTGCTPGGGKDSMGVFFDAGLLFETSAGSGTAYRQELKCHTVNRKKRNAAIMDVRSSLLKNYTDPVESECCLDGMKEAPLSYTCEACSDDIVNSQGCRDAFLHCCKAVETLRAEKREEDLKLAHSEEEDTSFIDSNEIVTRTIFPESWLWHDIKFPACPRNTPNCDTTSFVKYFYFSDSITTWQFIGISLSRTNGICVGDPFEVIVKKDFFIDLRLPYSAVRGEQIEIKAILHNYSPDRITVRVDLTEEEHVCSSASKRGRYHQEVTVGPETTRSVPFVIIPMKEGERRIEVKAAVKGSYLNDGVMKMLRVVVREPMFAISHKIYGVQNEVISSGIPRNILVPNTATSTQIFVTGREQVSKLVENAIGGNSMGTLIIQPSGSGELNIMSMTLPVIATLYLDKTNQWETVGFEKRKEALQYIKTGYTNELAYRKNDGSFAAFTSFPSSTWLTAYVAKVFVMTHHLVEIQNHVICEAVKFLILTRQQPDGVFKEFAPVIHQEMTGDVAGLDSDASMTAFCLIAMQESRSVCSGTVTMLPGGIDKAVAYLENRLPSLTNPYAVAMTSYALANENKLNKKILYKFVSPELSHWPVHKGSVYTLEATAYALLALVKTQNFEDARPVVRWFSQQQKVGGGYGSTQATIMVYQAVAEYWNNTKEPQYDLNVDIQFSGMPSPNKYYFNRDNYYATRTFKVRTHSFRKLVSRYYAKPKEQKSDCQDFTLSVELIPGNLMSFIALYKNRDRDAGMSILDIGLPFGFAVETRDLDLLSTGRGRTIAKYEMYKALSERGSLIIYLDKVSHTRPEEIAFRIKQEMRVGVLQPTAVSVYEYYEQTRCVKYYNAQMGAGKLHFIFLTCPDCVLPENCSMQKENITNDQRQAKICESTETHKVDFAYKVHVAELIEEVSTDSHKVQVLDTIKEGNLDANPVNKHRIFLSYQHCREALGLEKDKTYLIMGSDKAIYRDDKMTFKYMIDERTWVEYWPTAEECQTDKYWARCLGLELMVNQYSVFGCIEE
uniref:Complement component c3a, duplicate 5 n=1 Tax=Oreochromis aureus TaxID=47969 RepID=A0A668VQN4_OREAU